MVINFGIIQQTVVAVNNVASLGNFSAAATNVPPESLAQNYKKKKKENPKPKNKNGER